MAPYIPRLVVPLTLGAASIGAIVMFKEVMGGGKYGGLEQLDGWTVIVTGANTGIGRETALELARRKARVILACRDLDKCRVTRKAIATETLNKKIVCRECDLASFESIRKFTDNINQNEKRLDLLVNNAGVMRCPRGVTKDGIEKQLGTNHMGHFLLTMLLLDKLKASAPSRIVTVSSVAHQRSSGINFSDLNSEVDYDAATAYQQSKLANVLFTKKLARELAGSSVTCYAVHPGIVNTEIGRHMSVNKSWFSAVFLQPFLWLLLKTPRQGAQTTLFAALNPHITEQSGSYYSNQAEASPSEAACDVAAQERLWQVSLKWTRLR